VGDVASAKRLGNLWDVGERDQRHRRGHLIRNRGSPLPIGIQDIRCQLAVKEQSPAIEPGDRKEVYLHAGYYTEVVPPTAQSPEQVQVALGRDVTKLSVGGDDFDGAHMVRGVAVLARQQTQSAAQSVGDRAHDRGAARQWREPVRRRFVDHLLPAHTRLDMRCARVGVHPDTSHPASGDQYTGEALGGDRQQRVPGALHAHRQPAGELHRGTHVFCPTRADDHDRPVLDGGLEASCPLRVVAIVARYEHGSLHPAGQSVYYVANAASGLGYSRVGTIPVLFLIHVLFHSSSSFRCFQ
jgi:hypothetical protein